MDVHYDVPLPAFLDPLLDQVRSAIPPPLYALLLRLLSQALAFITTLFAFIIPLLSTKPWEWDAQTLLPPLISVLTAYLALVSLYRTTAWMIRTSLWFVKWGGIVALLIAGIGWVVGTANSIGITGAGDMASVFGGAVFDAVNSVRRTAGDSGSQATRLRFAPSQKVSKPKPKPWESFDRHREWRQQEEEGGRNGDAMKIIEGIVGAAGQMMKDSRWWEATKSVSDEESYTEIVMRKMAFGKGKSSRPR